MVWFLQVATRCMISRVPFNGILLPVSLMSMVLQVTFIGFLLLPVPVYLNSIVLLCDLQRYSFSQWPSMKLFLQVAFNSMVSPSWLQRYCSPSGLQWHGFFKWPLMVWFLPVDRHFLMWCPGSDVVLDCMDVWSLPSYLLSRVLFLPVAVNGVFSSMAL